MSLLLAIDGIFLSFFNKIAHSFARFTGRSNFFLAKISVCISTSGAMIATANYWFPLLSIRSTLLFMIIMASVALLAINDMVMCDKAEGATLQDEQTKPMLPVYYTPTIRMTYVILSIPWLFTMVPYCFDHERGFRWAKIIFTCYTLALAAHYYFAALDPPQIGKSKIREWAERFANLFHKPVPVPVKTK